MAIFSRHQLATELVRRGLDQSRGDYKLASEVLNLHLKAIGRSFSSPKMSVPAPATAGSVSGLQTSFCEKVSLVVGSPGGHDKSTYGQSVSGGVEVPCDTTTR